MLTSFTFHTPAYIVAGINSCQKTGLLLKEWSAREDIMLVWDKKILEIGLNAKIVESIM